MGRTELIAGRTKGDMDGGANGSSEAGVVGFCRSESTLTTRFRS